MKFLFLTILLATAGSAFGQTVRYVKTVASGSGDGSSWANASNELQSMIDASAPGDQVWVAQGVYYPSVYATACSNCTTSRNYTFSMKSDVAIYGGFQGTESTIGERQLGLYPTVLDGDLDQDGLLNTGNVFSVVTALNTNAGAILDGFQVRNGHANGGASFSAGTPAQSIITSASGGIYCWNSTAVIRNCNVTNCWGYSGGGIYMRNSGMQILDCRFENNLQGGGISIVTSSATRVDRCHFSGNQSGNYGGGIKNDSPGSTIVNCVFINNSAVRGGAISNYSGNNSVIANCLFAGNTASAEGGALHNTFYTNGNAVNCTFYNNAAPVGSLMWNWSSNGGVINSIVYGHVPGTLVGSSNGGVDPTITYSLLEAVFAGTGNVVGDPLFFNVLDWDGTDNIYRTADDGLVPQSGSPAINMGNNASVPAGITTDITGVSRIEGGTVNAGAYEVIVCIAPDAPANTTVAALVCPGAAATVSATGSGTLSWYTQPSGGAYLGSGEYFTTPPLAGTTTFYVQDSTCAAGTRTAVTVTVGDTIDPQVMVPSDTVVYVADGSCGGVVHYSVSATDNCGAPTVVQTAGLPSGSTFPVGVTLNVFEVSDQSGNTSTASFEVTIINSTADTQAVTICEGTFYAIGSSVYTAAGTYTDTLQSLGGCDSLVTTQLAVLPVSLTSQQLTICSGESIQVGVSVYTGSGTYVDTLQAANGCDSLVTTQLTVLPQITFSQQRTICEGAVLQVGNSTYTTSGIYTDTLTAAGGCDSLITTDLTVLPLPLTDVSLDSTTITAGIEGATYQWVSCTSLLPVPGATDQVFTATEMDWYAVVVTVGDCVDTSECVFIDLVSLEATGSAGWIVQVAPNPVADWLSVYSSESAHVLLTDAHGKVVLAPGVIAGMQQVQLTDLAPGMYFMRLIAQHEERVVRLIKQ